LADHPRAPTRGRPYADHPAFADNCSAFAAFADTHGAVL
jgi:hypothetical protein